MSFHIHSPGATLFGLIVAGILSLVGGRKRCRRTTYPSPEPSAPTQEERNVSAMEKIVDRHRDCTAEVLSLNVFGKKRVSTFRLIEPGKKVDIRCYDDDYKVFLFGEFMGELYPGNDSNLPRLFAEDIKFESYLGGRDRTMLNNDNMDFCSIIIFYKLDGVPPTKVNLR